MNEERWITRLAKPGRLLAPLPGGTGYGVYTGSDRRRRPSVRLGLDQVRKAVRDGLLISSREGGYVLTADARKRLVGHGEETQANTHATQHQALSRQSIMDEDGKMRDVMVNKAQSPLYRYLKRPGHQSGLIDETQMAAGERLRDDFTFAAMGRPSSSDWSMIPKDRSSRAGQDPAALSDARIDARQRVMEALAAVGSGLDHLVMQVCIREVGLRSTESSLSWPDRSAGPALRLALDRLAIHYGLKQAPRSANPFS